MTNLVISVVFFIMVAVFLISLSQYWSNILDPRLSLAAKTQAEILSQSQSGTLLKAIEIKDQKKREKALEEVFSEILLITDPSINEPFIKGISLEIDYELVDAVVGSIDLRAGVTDCELCIKTEVAIFDDELRMLAIAHFNVTDAYYRWLGSDLKSGLISQAFVTIGLLSVVWIVVLLLVSRINKVSRNIERSDRAKTRFIANVSHELRTPLNAILGYTQLFKKDDALMVGQSRGVNTIHRSAEHLLALINDILDFSRVESEHLQLFPEHVNLSTFINTLVEMTVIRADLKDIKLNTVFSNDLPEKVFIDEKRLRQVLLNLLNNAVKFTDRGSVTFEITTKLSTKDQQKCSLLFSIADTGVGIPQSMLKDIFLPYQQVENAITSAEGSGLGLSISKNLLELMGSKLNVQSKKGQGSVFSFELTLSTMLLPAMQEKISSNEAMVNDAMSVVRNENVHLKLEVAESKQGMLRKDSFDKDLTLPDHSVLFELKEYAAKHNVLAIRQLITTLEKEDDYRKFVELITPLARNYQFSKLLHLLEQLS
jgi:signal transduction histidine kinase